MNKIKERIFEPSNFLCFALKTLRAVKKMFESSNFSWFGVEDIMSGGLDLD